MIVSLVDRVMDVGCVDEERWLCPVIAAVTGEGGVYGSSNAALVYRRLKDRISRVAGEASNRLRCETPAGFKAIWDCDMAEAAW